MNPDSRLGADSAAGDPEGHGVEAIGPVPELGVERGIVLSWAGRSQARVSIPKPRILEPVPEQSDVTDEDPGNLLIEGDNRQAMVSLLPQFAGKVDVVLIDPPYNTGKNDFRYDDARFKDPDADSRKGDFVSAEDGGRHAKWLNQMAPTLRIIKDLMAPHAVIFVHINDIELPRLLLLMEELFGEVNRIALLVWDGVTDNNAGRVVVEHEYIACFAKNLEAVAAVWNSPEALIRDRIVERAREVVSGQPDLMKAQQELRKALAADKDRLGNFTRYYRLDEHWTERGPYASIRNTDNPGKPGYFYDVKHPATQRTVAKPTTGYRFAPDTMDRLLAEDRVVFGKDETKLLEIKRYITEVEFPLRSVIELDARAGANTLAKLWTRGEVPFRNPKPVELEELLLTYTTSKDALVLDCFAGSGTTAHAVMRLNGKDGGHRRFILVENGTTDDAYAATLTGERLRRARTLEGLPGGFSFLRVGPRINVEAFEKLRHRHVVTSILQTDASGRGGGIKAIEGRRFVVGFNARREAICVYYEPKTHAPVNRDVLREMFLEVDELGLARPLRVYGESCDVFGSETFRFFKIPDEITNNLTVSLGTGG
jgi:adenine-specific DNA-methyltransferase